MIRATACAAIGFWCALGWMPVWMLMAAQIGPDAAIAAYATTAGLLGAGLHDAP